VRMRVVKSKLVQSASGGNMIIQSAVNKQ